MRQINKVNVVLMSITICLTVFSLIELIPAIFFKRDEKHTQIYNAEVFLLKKDDHSVVQRFLGDTSQDLGFGCNAQFNTEYLSGEILTIGDEQAPITFKDIGDCCQLCKEHDSSTTSGKGCNVWSYCADSEYCSIQHQVCILKHVPFGEIAPQKTSNYSGWISGLLNHTPTNFSDYLNTDEDRSYFTIVTAEGVQQFWQIRIHYYWFQKMKLECRKLPICHMGGWVRILHSGKPDELMGEIPTFVAEPNPNTHGYVVLNRPYAIIQWLKSVEIKERYIFMSEPDHLFKRPLPNLMLGDRMAAYPFFYINSDKAQNQYLLQQYLGDLSWKDFENIAPIGNAPTFITFKDLASMADEWLKTATELFEIQDIQKGWSWVCVLQPKIDL